MAQKITIQDLQFNGKETDGKLRRLMDDLRLLGSAYNKLVDELTTLTNSTTDAVAPHVLATESGLGADHTVSGLTAKDVLIADSATAARFRQLTFNDLAQTAFDTPVNGDVIKYLDGYYVLGAVSVSISGGHGITIAGTTISVNESQLDHGSLSGLGDNDHPQYLLKTSYYKHFLLMGA